MMKNFKPGGHRALGAPQWRGLWQQPPGTSVCLGLVRILVEGGAYNLPVLTGLIGDTPIPQTPSQAMRQAVSGGFHSSYFRARITKPGVIAPWGRGSVPGSVDVFWGLNGRWLPRIRKSIISLCRSRASTNFAHICWHKPRGHHATGTRPRPP